MGTQEEKSCLEQVVQYTKTQAQHTSPFHLYEIGAIKADQHNAIRLFANEFIKYVGRRETISILHNQQHLI